MKEIPAFKDTRLLEALDYIDRDLIAEVIDDIKAPDMSAQPERDKKATRRSIRQVIALAASLLLVSAFIPIVTYISQHTDFFPAGIFSDRTEESSGEPDVTVALHEENAPYPIFTPNLEPITDEKIAELKAVWYKMVYDAEYEAYSRYYEGTNFSAQSKNDGTAKAAKSTAERYTALLFSANKEDHFRGRYYGTVSDCVIFAFNTYLEEEYNFITLGNTTILNDYSFYIFAYKDGVIKTVEDAYADGWLNADDAEKIKDRHNKFNAYGYWIEEENQVYSYAKFVTDLEEITDKKIEQINEALFEESYEKRFALWESDRTYKTMYETNRRIKEMYALDSYHVAKNASDAFVIGEEQTIESFEESFRYYGTFGNSVIWANVTDLNSETHIVISGYEFYYSNYTEVYVYNNGKHLTLDKAYEKGLLTEADAAKLYERYVAYEEYLDSPQASESEIPTISFPDDMTAKDLYIEVMHSDWLVRDGSSVISGEGLDKEFYEKSKKGEPASLKIAIYNENSPSDIHFEVIVYNGECFELLYQYRRDGKEIEQFRKRFKYIIKYEGEEINQGVYMNRLIESYLLVNDNTLTYEKVMNQMELMISITSILISP